MSASTRTSQPASRPCSYARTRVARSSSTSRDSIEEGATATRRWTKEETIERIADAPTLSHPRLEETLLQEVITGYVHITGDLVRSEKKRNLIAACYRVHGDDFLPQVQRLFASTGTATNLLGEIRRLPPRQKGGKMADPPGQPCNRKPDDTSRLLPGLTYGPDDRPPYDATSSRRYDRHRSNPAAARFFTDVELGVALPRSPTAEALSR